MSSTITAAGAGALAALTTGTDNVAIGTNTLAATTSGTQNVAVGSQAGKTNAAAGSTGNILIGYNVDVPSNPTSNYLNIGGVITGSMTANPSTLSLAYSPASGDASTKIATTAFVQNALTGGGGTSGGTIAFMAIGGLIISSIAGTHTTASLSVSVGGCADSGGADYIAVPSALSWAVSNGNAANGYAGGTTLPNSSTIHVFVMVKSDKTSPASFASTSVTPTLPSAYTGGFYRRIGSFVTTSAGAPIPYTSLEAEGGSTVNYLTTQVLDINTTSTTSSSRTLYTLGSVPSGVRMGWIGRLYQGSGAAQTFIATSPDETDVAPTSDNPTTAPMVDAIFTTASGTIALVGVPILTTNTSAQIGIRTSTANLTFLGNTRGWKDFRRA